MVQLQSRRGGPGTLKKQRIPLRRPQSFVISTLSARVASGIRCWTLPRFLLGRFWPPTWLKTVLEFVLERPRAVQEHSFSAPGPSKSAPRALQERSRRPPRAQEAPRCVREAPRGRFGPLQGPSESVRRILMARWRALPAGNWITAVLVRASERSERGLF